VDLRASSSPSSLPAGAIAIPRARQPFPTLTRAEREAPSGPAVSPADTPARTASAVRIRRVVALAQAVLVVVGSYVLIGAGIGAAAGSVMVGMGAGLIAGLCAIGAILLIRGSALVTGTTTDAGAGSETSGC
jgi:tetrahydrodipicolinate N-succinyltransferase